MFESALYIQQNVHYISYIDILYILKFYIYAILSNILYIEDLKIVYTYG